MMAKERFRKIFPEPLFLTEKIIGRHLFGLEMLKA